MGAHSLGGAKAENSGYRGKWTGPSNAGFSEVYYNIMLSSNITWINLASTTFRLPGKAFTSVKGFPA